MLAFRRTIAWRRRRDPRSTLALGKRRRCVNPCRARLVRHMKSAWTHSRKHLRTESLVLVTVGSATPARSAPGAVLIGVNAFSPVARCLARLTSRDGRLRRISILPYLKILTRAMNRKYRLTLAFSSLRQRDDRRTLSTQRTRWSFTVGSRTLLPFVVKSMCAFCLGAVATFPISSLIRALVEVPFTTIRTDALRMPPCLIFSSCRVRRRA